MDLVSSPCLCYNGMQGVINMELNKLIKRINELAAKKRSTGLTLEEEIEQKELYQQYLGNIRSQLKAQLDNIEIVDKKPVQH